MKSLEAEEHELNVKLKKTKLELNNVEELIQTNIEDRKKIEKKLSEQENAIEKINKENDEKRQKIEKLYNEVEKEKETSVKRKRF